jgi:hypothetical protein
MQILQAKHLVVPGKRTTGKSALRRKGSFDHLPRSGLVLVYTIERTIPIAYTSAETPSHLRNLHQSLGIEIRLYRMKKYLFDTEHAFVALVLCIMDTRGGELGHGEMSI